MGVLAMLDNYFCGALLVSHTFYLFLQALYFCVPFREQLLEYYGNNKSVGDSEENLLTCLADLFLQVRNFDLEISWYRIMVTAGQFVFSSPSITLAYAYIPSSAKENCYLLPLLHWFI